MRKLAWFAFSFAFGTFICRYFLPLRALPLTAVCVSAAGLFLYALLRGKRRPAALLAAFGLAAGLMWNYGYDTLILASARALDGTEATVNATVEDFPVERDYGAYVDVRVDAGGHVPLKGRAYIYDGSAEGLRPGDRLRFTASFSTADKVGETEITSYTSKGFFLFIRSIRELEVTDSPGVTLTNFHRYLARAIREKIAETFPRDGSGFMLALLTGDRTLLNEDQGASAAMERAGVTHIVSVSGMHVAILAGFLATVLGRRRWTILVTAPVLLIFMAVSGFSASVVRAVVMQLFVLTAPLLMRESDSLTSLSAALLLILLLNPYAIAGAGLQLSFAATLGIILFSQRLSGRFMKYAPKEKGFLRSAFSAISGAVSTTLGALALTAPFSAWYFHSVSLVAPLSNLLILWAVSPAFLLGAAAVGLAFLWLPAGRVLGFFPVLLSKYILLMAELLSRPRMACIYLTDPAMMWTFILLYLTCAVLVLTRAPMRAFVPVLCVGTVAVCGILLYRDLADRGREGYSLTVLDVGQGQSILISCDGHTAIIDCGSSSGVNAGRTAEFAVRSLGRRSADALILTHYHEDHANGVERLLAALDIQTLIVPEPRFTESDLDEEILAAAESAGTQVLFVTEETFVQLGTAGISLYPPLGTDTENERGLTALVSDNGFDTLITGDAPGYIERELIGIYGLPDIECLVVGHHGSSSSTTDYLLDAVTPEAAIVSVGRNSYGHPAQEVLDRLAARGITVLRTDEAGNITIRSR